MRRPRPDRGRRRLRAPAARARPRRSPSRDRPRTCAGYATRHERVALSSSTPSGSPSASRRMTPPAGSGVVAVDRRRGQRGATGEQRVVVVCPERARAGPGDALEVVGRRPAAPAVRVPAVPLEPGVGIAPSARCAAPIRRHPLLERRRVATGPRRRSRQRPRRGGGARRSARGCRPRRAPARSAR